MFKDPTGVIQPSPSPGGTFYYRSQGFSKTFTGKFEDTTLSAASKKEQLAQRDPATPRRKGGGAIEGGDKWWKQQQKDGGTSTRSAQEKENTWLKQQQLKSPKKLAQEDYAAEVIQARYKGYAQRSSSGSGSGPVETKMQPQPPPGSSKPMSALEKARARKLAKKQAAAQAAQAEQPPATPQVVRDVAKRTREQLKKHHQTLTACFRKMDTNGDNHISLAELKRGFEVEAHVALTDDEAKALFTAFDTDGGGSVDLREMMKTFRKIEKEGDVPPGKVIHRPAHEEEQMYFQRMMAAGSHHGGGGGHGKSAIGSPKKGKGGGGGWHSPQHPRAWRCGGQDPRKTDYWR